MKRPNILTAFAELLEALVERGDMGQRATTEALENLVSSLTDEIDRDCCRGELAVRLGRVNNFAEAAKLIDAIQNAGEQADFWRQLAKEQFKAGDHEGAFRSLRHSEEAIDTLRADYYRERADVFSLNAKLLDDFKLGERASETWNRAIQIAQTGQAADPNSSECSAALVNITGMLAELGRTELARTAADSITIPARRDFAYQLIEKASSQK